MIDKKSGGLRQDRYIRRMSLGCLSFSFFSNNWVYERLERLPKSQCSTIYNGLFYKAIFFSPISHRGQTLSIHWVDEQNSARHFSIEIQKRNLTTGEIEYRFNLLGGPFKPKKHHWVPSAIVKSARKKWLLATSKEINFFAAKSRAQLEKFLLINKEKPEKENQRNKYEIKRVNKHLCKAKN